MVRTVDVFQEDFPVFTETNETCLITSVVPLHGSSKDRVKSYLENVEIVNNYAYT